MKKQALSLIGVLSLLLAAGSAMAQRTEMNADVPFSFTVSGTTLPSGPYKISKIGSGTTVLLIQSKDGQAVKMVAPNAVTSSKVADHSKLVFHCYSGREHCFLYEIWVQGRDSGQQLPKTSLEKEVSAAALRYQEVPILASRR